VLGISPEAVRNRLSRGTLESIKIQGTVYVLIDSDRARHISDIPTDRPGESDALIYQMRGRIDSLERQLERGEERDRDNRRIIAALTLRIPAIEAPEAPQGPEPGEDRANVADRSVVVREMGTSAAGELIAKVLVEVVAVAGGVFLYVAGHARLSLLAAGGGLLLLVVVDLFSTRAVERRVSGRARTVVRWTYVTVALGIIAFLIYVAAGLLGGG